jgi:DNA-binding winged helix-turn-helix (wHTH) protein
MQLRYRHINRGPTANRRNPRRWAATKTMYYREPDPSPDDEPARGAGRPRERRAEAALQFGRFRVLVRQRQLLTEGAPVEIGTRAFDLLMVLVEADGALVTKKELIGRVWPSIVVSEENLKVQISALRKALGADRDMIRTEFGRGYRFTAEVRSDVVMDAGQRAVPDRLPIHPTLFRLSCRQSLASRAGEGRPEISLLERRSPASNSAASRS